MAYVKQGFTDEALTTLYYEALREGKDDSYIRARFGAPLSAVTQQRHGLSDVRHGGDAVPYGFLSQTPMRSYNQLGEPHYIDQAGRQYYGLGSNYPNQCYCRIPKGLTTRENRTGLVGVFRTDFPQAGEELLLSASKGFERSMRERIPDVTVIVQRRLEQTVAVCKLQVSEALSVPDGVDQIDGLDTEGEDTAGVLERRSKHAKEMLEKADAHAKKVEDQLRENHYAFPESVTSVPRSEAKLPRQSLKQRYPSMGPRTKNAKSTQTRTSMGKRVHVNRF